MSMPRTVSIISPTSVVPGAKVPAGVSVGNAVLAAVGICANGFSASFGVAGVTDCSATDFFTASLKVFR